MDDRHFPVGIVIGHEPLNRLVSEIFSIEVADTQTDGRRLTIRVA